MGVFSRSTSPYWWLWLETAPRGHQREKTVVRIGKTAARRRDSRRLANNVYHQRLNEIAARIHRLPTAPTPIAFTAYADLYTRDVIVHHKGASRELEILRVLRTAFANTFLHLIDRERVQRWMTARRTSVSACTVNREQDLLKSMFRHAVPKYLEASPLKGMAKLGVVPPKRRLLAPAEERKLLPKLKPDDRAIFLMGLDSLVRQGDILDLRREDDHGRTLYIRDPKDPNQSQPFEVPISRRLRAALDAVPKTDSPYYFPRRRRAETEAGRRMVLRSALARACKAAGLTYGKKQGGITFHWATRRTGATRMIQRKVDLKTVQAIGHWKHADVVLGIYAETTTAAMRKAVEVVSNHYPAVTQRKRR